jgi:hypothetical protein
MLKQGSFVRSCTCCMPSTNRRFSTISPSCWTLQDRTRKNYIRVIIAEVLGIFRSNGHTRVVPNLFFQTGRDLRWRLRAFRLLDLCLAPHTVFLQPFHAHSLEEYEINRCSSGIYYAFYRAIVDDQ